MIGINVNTEANGKEQSLYIEYELLNGVWCSEEDLFDNLEEAKNKVINNINDWNECCLNKLEEFDE